MTQYQVQQCPCSERQRLTALKYLFAIPRDSERRDRTASVSLGEVMEPRHLERLRASQEGLVVHRSFSGAPVKTSHCKHMHILGVSSKGPVIASGHLLSSPGYLSSSHRGRRCLICVLLFLTDVEKRLTFVLLEHGHLYRRSATSIVLLLCSLLLDAPTVRAETYYGRNPVDEGVITILGISDNTDFEIRQLPSNIVTHRGMVDRLTRLEAFLGSTREFKLTTSQSVVAVLRSSLFFNTLYPQEDGKRFWGRRFIMSPFSFEHVVFVRDDAVVRVLTSTGTLLVTSPTLSSGQVSVQAPG
jgi:hypothetical protein